MATANATLLKIGTGTSIDLAKSVGVGGGVEIDVAVQSTTDPRS